MHSKYYWQKVCMYNVETLLKSNCHKSLDLLNRKISITLRILYTIKINNKSYTVDDKSTNIKSQLTNAPTKSSKILSQNIHCNFRLSTIL